MHKQDRNNASELVLRLMDNTTLAEFMAADAALRSWTAAPVVDGKALDFGFEYPGGL